MIDYSLSNFMANIPNPSTQWGGEDILGMEAPDRPAGSDGREATKANGDATNWYFVDRDHPQATDDANVYGYPDKPRISLPDTIARPLVAGEVVHIDNRDDYLGGNGQSSIYGAGTPDNPIWICGYNKADKTNYSRYGHQVFIKGSYINIEYMDVGQYYDSNGTLRRAGFILRPHQGSQPHHIMQRRCYGRGVGLTGAGSVFSAYGDTTYRFEGVIFAENDIAGFGAMSGIQNDFHGFTAPNTINHVWIINNKCSNMGGDSVQIGTASITDIYRTSNVYITGNDFSDDNENAIDIKEADNVVVAANWIHDYSPDNTGDPDDPDFINAGFAVVAHNTAKDVWVFNNLIERCGTCLQLTSDISNFRVLFNVLRDTSASSNYEAGDSTGTAFTSWSSQGSMLVYGNVFDNVESGIVVTTGQDFTISNNLFINKKTPDNYDINFTESSPRALATLENNHFDANFKAYWGYDVTDVSTEPAFVNFTQGDPLILGDASVKNYEPQSGSVLIDGGVDMSVVFAEYQALFGVPLEGDQWLNQRVQGTGIDIGPWETGGILLAKLPKPATSLKVDAGVNSLRWTVNGINGASQQVLKNGILEATLGTYDTDYGLSGIASSVDDYQVTTVNGQGSSDSEFITSDIMSVTQLPDVFTEDLNLTKSHLAVRPYEYSNDGSLNIGEPQYVGDKFGIPSTDISFTKDSASVGNGFNYVLNDSGSILGSVSGTGTCEVVVGVSSREGDATGRLQVNSTYVDYMCTSGEFNKYKVSVGVTGTKHYTIIPKTSSNKHLLGIVSIQEQ